jgi:CRP/FNR family transcriptional regulator, cyclic AMP receptor protein
MTHKSMTTITLFRNSQNAKVFATGHTFFREGDAGDFMYALLEGEVVLVVSGRPIQTLGPGGIFGEMAIIDKEPRSATAVAKTGCKAVPIDQKQFAHLIQQTPLFAVNVMRVMAERLRNANVRK